MSRPTTKVSPINRNGVQNVCAPQSNIGQNPMKCIILYKPKAVPGDEGKSRGSRAIMVAPVRLKQKRKIIPNTGIEVENPAKIAAAVKEFSTVLRLSLIHI